MMERVKMLTSAEVRNVKRLYIRMLKLHTIIRVSTIHTIRFDVWKEL